jgi:major vault protein
LLLEHEEFWDKPLEPAIERLLSSTTGVRGYIPVETDSLGNQKYSYGTTSERRDKTKAVTYKAPHNSAVQIFDYKTKESRIVFGPELVMLEPYEDFTLITLSGGAPK